MCGRTENLKTQGQGIPVPFHIQEKKEVSFMALSLPYYYGHSGEQYAFFRIPKLLLTDDRFAELSTDAKLL